MGLFKKSTLRQNGLAPGTWIIKGIPNFWMVFVAFSVQLSF